MGAGSQRCPGRGLVPLVEPPRRYQGVESAVPRGPADAWPTAGPYRPGGRARRPDVRPMPGHPQLRPRRPLSKRCEDAAYGCSARSPLGGRGAGCGSAGTRACGASLARVAALGGAHQGGAGRADGDGWSSSDAAGLSRCRSMAPTARTAVGIGSSLFGTLSVQLFIAIIEFKVTVLASFVLVPFAALRPDRLPGRARARQRHLLRHQADSMA